MTVILLMRPLRLSPLLIGLNVGLLLLAVSGVAFIAVRFLRRLADDQALARVAQAGTSAQHAVIHAAQNVATSAQLLGEHPTLLQLQQANDSASLTNFLTQFQKTSRLDGCAVLIGDQLVAQSGAQLDWIAMQAAQPQDQDYFFHAAAEGDSLILGASASIPSLSNAVVIIVVRLDETFSRQISEATGLPVTILGPQAIPPSGALAALRLQAFRSGELRAVRLTNPDAYVAVAPLRTSTGEIAGLVEAELSAADMTRSLSQLVQTLLLFALVVVLLAALVSLFIGRRLSFPLRTLTRAAARIGQGDLTTPIPITLGFEMGTLSATLEVMRRRLLALTANLRRQQSESHAIVTGIVEGVFTVDRERRLQYLNPQAAQLLGVTPPAVIGHFCGDMLNPQGKDGLRPCEEHCPIIHARFRVGARATEYLLLVNGRRRTVIITSAPPAENQTAGSPSLEGTQVQVIREETEEEATRRLRDTVLANISHEFRTPLAAQLASIELLLDQLPDLATPQIAELVISLQRGTLRLTQLIDNLLESVRIEAGRATIRRRPVILDEVIEQALEMTRPLMDQRQQAVVVELPYPLPTISGDAPLLTQVFVNLLANANKFSPAASTIRITGAVDEETVTLSVEDEGPGLPTTDEALFIPFVRSMTAEPEAGGVGLGLWIVKSIVERHGGRVEARSRPGGTIVSVTLSRKSADENSGC